MLSLYYFQIGLKSQLFNIFLCLKIRVKADVFYFHNMIKKNLVQALTNVFLKKKYFWKIPIFMSFNYFSSTVFCDYRDKRLSYDHKIYIFRIPITRAFKWCANHKNWIIIRWDRASCFGKENLRKWV